MKSTECWCGPDEMCANCSPFDRPLDAPALDALSTALNIANMLGNELATVMAERDSLRQTVERIMCVDEDDDSEALVKIWDIACRNTSLCKRIGTI